MSPGGTNLVGPGSDIVGELGYGPNGTSGLTSSSWTWTAATYHADADTDNDEHKAEISPELGNWSYAYKFKYKAEEWRYCDLGGNDTFDKDQQGKLTVVAEKPATLDWCILQGPAAGAIDEGGSHTVYG